MWVQKPPQGTPLRTGHPLAKGLVGCWLFNENGGNKVYDLSGYGNTGTLTNMDPATDWVPGKFGSVLDFDGSNDYVNCGDNDIFDITQAVSIVAMFKADSSGGSSETWQQIAGKGSVYSSHSSYLLVYNSNDLKFYIDASGGDYAVYQNAGKDEWIHAVGTYDRNTVKIYVNGIKGTDGTETAPIDVDTSSFAIGRGSGGFNHDDRFKGFISTVYLYNRALTAHEIQQFYIDPFCMFEKSRRVKYFYIAPAVGNPWYIYANQD